MRPIRTEADINDLYHGVKALSVLSAWTQLGVFQALSDGPKPITDLPGNPRAIAITVPLMRHLGLIVGDDNQIGLSETAKMLLERGEMPTARNFAALREWSRMGQVLEYGGPVPGDDGEPRVTTGGVQPDDPEATQRFLDMLYRTSEQPAQQVVTWLTPHIKAGGHLLDLGGGHGRYARSFADRGFTVTIMDLPLVVELAKARHGEALNYRAGDFLDGDEFGEGYDVVLMSNIVHGQSPEENAELMERIFESLAPGGFVVLKDMFIDDHGRDPENAVFFGLTMLYYTRHGQSYTIDEVRSWCAGAGFEPPVMVVLERFSLVIARKPE